MTFWSVLKPDTTLSKLSLLIYLCTQIKHIDLATISSTSWELFCPELHYKLLSSFTVAIFTDIIYVGQDTGRVLLVCSANSVVSLYFEQTLFYVTKTLLLNRYVLERSP